MRGVDSWWIMLVKIALLTFQRPIKLRSSLSCHFCTLAEFSIKNIREFQVFGEYDAIQSRAHYEMLVGEELKDDINKEIHQHGQHTDVWAYIVCVSLQQRVTWRKYQRMPYMRCWSRVPLCGVAFRNKFTLFLK
jgi:hypothetical protein